MMVHFDYKDVVESGSNSNGSYVRLSDGTQICWWDSPGGANPVTWTYPAPFATQPVVTFSTRSTGAQPIIWALDRNTNNGLPTTTDVTVVGWYWDATNTTFSTATSAEVHFIAIGRWK